ncbi:hypothetical protein [Deminuibacter soli]|uniref:Uncharacterized protein n=1 Tax=Deminuibacter soli TaxID=2291815 RepID=A0A3E1NJC4_9BACT|nr:hypothetical protein [Deminuibacter soli]RFM28035.1 hypothetical protein DXN05_10880 [Deminuibacter soli]
MNFKQRIAAHKLGVLLTRDLIQTAATGTEEGYKSGILHQMASEGRNMHPLQLSELYTAALSELGITEPIVKAALLRLLRYYIHKMVYQQMDVAKGFALVDSMMNLTEYFYPDTGLEGAYEQYTAIAAYSSPWFEPDDAGGLSQQDAIDHAKQALYDALQHWLNTTAVLFSSEESLSVAHAVAV